MRHFPGIILVLALVGIPARATGQTREGFCRGDVERARLWFEAVGFRLDAWTRKGVSLAGDTARAGFDLAVRMALWELHGRSWRWLEEVLADPGGTADALTAIRPYWHRAAEILALKDPVLAGELRARLDQAAEDPLAAWAVCRAVKLGHAEPCRLLEQSLAQQAARSAPGRVEECHQLFVTFGIMASARCDDASMTLAAWTLGWHFQDAWDWCYILKNGAAERCAMGRVQSPHELAGCRALATLDPEECRAPALSASQQEDCLGKLLTYRYVRGELAEWDWRPWMMNPVFEAAVHAARDPYTSCRDAALSAYNQAGRIIFSLPLVMVGWSSR